MVRQNTMLLLVGGGRLAVSGGANVGARPTSCPPAMGSLQVSAHEMEVSHYRRRRVDA
jgi:hypothetical protein